ncbi:MAG: isoprenylcysteine carboxylmethyltransferase family protein [Alphaproteobacteria bacterium]|nr:isoprenylcysteine carboxylmethyltransferase family protein [Alphaproteobacteria bacterium]
MIRKGLMLAYAFCAYLLATFNILYIIGFLADIGVPKGIGDGPESPIWIAVFIDASLVGLFGLLHSITARSSFKRWWTTIIPAPIERATYLYITAVLTTVLVVFWRPIPLTVWHLGSVVSATAIYVAYGLTWAMMFAATFHFGHFRFLGLAQAWENFRNEPPENSSMTVRYLYALVRHPISLGWMVTPLLTPHLTVGHLVFAASTVAYILIATRFEEADLVEALGENYLSYRQHVPAFLPLSRHRSQPDC